MIRASSAWYVRLRLRQRRSNGVNESKNSARALYVFMGLTPFSAIASSCALAIKTDKCRPLADRMHRYGVRREAGRSADRPGGCLGEATACPSLVSRVARDDSTEALRGVRPDRRTRMRLRLAPGNNP